MIRRSSAIGLAALALSVLIHIAWISVTFTTDVPQPPQNSAADTVSLGSSFEDVVEFEATPIEPEPPEQPEEVQQETQDRLEPTSEALVASPNPENTPSPDTGTSPAVEPGVTNPVTAETGSTPDPEVLTPSAGEADTASDATVTPPVGSDAESQTAQGVETGDLGRQAAQDPLVPESVEAPQPENETVSSPAPEIIAALPPAEAEAPDITIPVVESDTSEVAPQSDQPTLSSSLRPRLRPPERSAQGSPDGTDIRETLRAPSEVIESPLAAYARDGTNLFAGQRGGQQSAGQSFGGGRGPGNADETNYTGLILVHLNRIPPVPVSGRGWARVVFRINPDGTLASVDIIDGTGVPEIDRAAAAQIRQAVPFPKPPDGQSKLLNFVYRIE